MYVSVYKELLACSYLDYANTDADLQGRLRQLWTGGAHGGTWAHMEWFVSHTTLSCSGQVSHILLMFVFDLWRTLKWWSSHRPSHDCSVGWGLHTEMNTKHKQLCLCQRLDQGSGNKNDDFWQIWAGTWKEGERSAFPDVFLSLSPS